MKKTVIFIILVIILAIIFSINGSKRVEVTDFESCALAGNPIMESSPRQCTFEGKTFIEGIEDDPYLDVNRKYTSKDVEKCKGISLLCISGYIPFNDKTGCGCELIGADSEKHFCPDERNTDGVCITLYDPVCGWNDPKKVQCIKFPCAETYSNSCESCKNLDVLYYTKGECPTD